MAAEEADSQIVRRGVQDDYYWLTCTGDVYMGTVLHLCPELVLHRYLAVTSHDSGVLRLTEKESGAGWTSYGEIAYSPLVESLDQLRYQRDGLDAPGYDEWYVLDYSRELAGEIFHGNIFEYRPSAAQLLVFVNMFAFVLHDPKPYISDILELFWKQLKRIRPESYIADGRDCVTLVSKNKLLVDAVQERLVRASTGSDAPS